MNWTVQLDASSGVFTLLYCPCVERIILQMAIEQALNNLDGVFRVQ